MAFGIGQQHLFRLGRLLLGRQDSELVQVLPHQLHLSADVAVERLHLLAADARRERDRQAFDPQVETDKLILKRPSRKFMSYGGQHSTVDSLLASHPEATSSNPSTPKIFKGEFELAKVNRWHCKEQQTDA